MRIDLTQEPNWTDSETNVSEIWKNPLISLKDRLLIADGAIAHQRKIIENLRNKIKLEGGE